MNPKCDSLLSFMTSTHISPVQKNFSLLTRFLGLDVMIKIFPLFWSEEIVAVFFLSLKKSSSVSHACFARTLSIFSFNKIFEKK